MMVLKSAPAEVAVATSPDRRLASSSSSRWRIRARSASFRLGTPHSTPAQASTHMTSISSSAFFCETSVTRRVRFGDMSMRPSADSSTMASRTGVMLTPSRSASSASLMTVPGASFPVTISSRRCRAVASVRVSGREYDMSRSRRPGPARRPLGEERMVLGRQQLADRRVLDDLADLAADELGDRVVALLVDQEVAERLQAHVEAALGPGRLEDALPVFR